MSISRNTEELMNKITSSFTRTSVRHIVFLFLPVSHSALVPIDPSLLQIRTFRVARLETVFLAPLKNTKIVSSSPLLTFSEVFY